MVRAAAFARPETVSQRQTVIDAATDVARLGRRKEAVNALDFRTVPVGFVLAEATEHPPTAVGDTLGERVVLEHPRHIQVFELDEAVLIHKSMTELVQEVGSLSGNVLVLACDQQTRFVAIAAVLLLARERALQLLQSPFGLP